MFPDQAGSFLIMETERNIRKLNNDEMKHSGSSSSTTEEDKSAQPITEDSIVDLTSSTSEEEGSCEYDLDPVHFLPEGSKALKEYEKADDRANRRKIQARSNKKRTKPKLKLSEIDSKELILKAAEKGRVDVVEYSLDRDLSLLHCTDDDGYTPLHRAAYCGHVEVIRALLIRGADISARTTDGWQPLHNACRWGQTAVASILLQNGADINSQTVGLQTPLHLAVASADGTSMLELLLSNRWLDSSLCNKQGETAFDIARRSGAHYELFEMVEDCVNVK